MLYWGSTNGIHNASVVIELPNTALVEEIKVITYYNVVDLINYQNTDLLACL
mgnify:CR=1 FL=1